MIKQVLLYITDIRIRMKVVVTLVQVVVESVYTVINIIACIHCKCIQKIHVKPYKEYNYISMDVYNMKLML